MGGSKPLRSKGWRSSAGCRSRLRPLRRAELRPERKRDRGAAMRRSTLAVTGVGRAGRAGADGAGGRHDLGAGTGGPRFSGAVAVRRGRSAGLAPAGGLAGAQGRERIDASGLGAGPGLGEARSPSRGALLRADGRAASKVTQRVTTEILGEG